MSRSHYYKIHELLEQLPEKRIIRPIRRPQVRGRPQPGCNGIYFMYQKGEAFTFKNKTYDRIVYVGINKVEGRLKKRLNDYTRIGFYPSLKEQIEKALAELEGVPRDAINASEVDKYVRDNFTHRVLFLESAEEGKKWEKKIIPTLAQYSAEFVSSNWLGRSAGLPHGIWNTKHTKGPMMLEDEDLRQLSELVKAQLKKTRETSEC